MRLKRLVGVAFAMFGVSLATILVVGLILTPAPRMTGPENGSVGGASQEAAEPVCGSANGVCTAEQVAAHNSKTDCWVIYDRSYYNVTAFVRAHPGGVAVFNAATCGQDISSYLSGEVSAGGRSHDHSGAALEMLKSYKVGPVRG